MWLDEGQRKTADGRPVPGTWVGRPQCGACKAVSKRLIGRIGEIMFQGRPAAYRAKRSKCHYCVSCAMKEVVVGDVVAKEAMRDHRTEKAALEAFNACWGELPEEPEEHEQQPSHEPAEQQPKQGAQESEAKPAEQQTKHDGGQEPKEQQPSHEPRDQQPKQGAQELEAKPAEQQPKHEPEANPARQEPEAQPAEQKARKTPPPPPAHPSQLMTDEAKEELKLNLHETKEELKALHEAKQGELQAEIRRLRNQNEELSTMMEQTDVKLRKMMQMNDALKQQNEELNTMMLEANAKLTKLQQLTQEGFNFEKQDEHLVKHFEENEAARARMMEHQSDMMERMHQQMVNLKMWLRQKHGWSSSTDLSEPEPGSPPGSGDTRRPQTPASASDFPGSAPSGYIRIATPPRPPPGIE